MDPVTDHVCTDDCVRDLPSDIEKLSKKYIHLLQQPISISDPTQSIIESKNQLIQELQNEISILNQKIIDLTIHYNEKIEIQRMEHKKNLYRQYVQFSNKLEK